MIMNLPLRRSILGGSTGGQFLSNHAGAAPQHRGNGGCGLASTIAQVGEAEPERDNALNRVGVVPAFIAPLLIGGMCSGPIEFRANPVFFVQVVEVPVACALPNARLPPGRWEPVRTFHPVNIAVFEQGQRSLR